MGKGDSRKRRWGADAGLPKVPPWQTSPVELLRTREGTLVPQALRELVALLRQQNSEPGIAEGLWQLINERDCLPAVEALRGTSNSGVRTKIWWAIRFCLDGKALLQREDSFGREARNSHWYQNALYYSKSKGVKYLSPCSPLALAGTSDPNEVELLFQAVQYDSKIDQFKHVEKDFRKYAAAALMQNEKTFARILNLMFTTWNECIYEAILAAYRSHAPRHQKNICRDYAKRPHRKATYGIARELQQRSKIRSLLCSVWPSRRYREFIKYAK